MAAASCGTGGAEVPAAGDAAVAVCLAGWLAVTAELTLIPGFTPHYFIFRILPQGLTHDLILLAGALSSRRHQLHPVG